MPIINIRPIISQTKFEITELKNESRISEYVLVRSRDPIDIIDSEKERLVNTLLASVKESIEVQIENVRDEQGRGRRISVRLFVAYKK
jgi:hypothetical protein